MRNCYRLTIISFVVFFISMGLLSCNKFKGDQKVPAYIHIDTFLLTTDYPYEGAASHKITDVWLYVDDNVQGCYELPATIPVLEKGKHKISIYPGIKLNGISATRTINPFYQPYIVEDYIFEEYVIDTLHPTTTYYSQDETLITFGFTEDFEKQTINLTKTSDSDTTIIKTDSVAEIWNDAENNSHYSGYVWIGDTLNYFRVASPEFHDLPNQGDFIFLEIDYKCTEKFEVGLFAKMDAINTINLIYVNPSPTWNKIYVNLGPSITEAHNAEYFKFYLAGSVDESKSAEYYFDNLKVVYRGKKN